MSLVFIASPTETFTPTQSGALATIIHECCRAAKREGILPWVIARSCNAQPFDWPQAILIDYPAVPASGPAWWLARAERKLLQWTHPGQRTYARRMAQAVHRHDLASLPLVVLNNPETAILLRQKFPQAQIFHWFHNQMEGKPRVRQQLPGAVNGFFSVSNFTSRWIEEYYGLADQSVSTIDNAVDATHFQPRKPASIPPELLVLNFVGRTGREKAPDLLLRAALKLVESKSKFAIQIVGSNHWNRFELDDYQRELKQLTNQLEEKGISVRFTGHVSRSELPSVLRQADINVMPSRWDEPFGMVTLEGMACGLATVASRTGGTPEVVGDAALLFEREDVDGLAAHLQDLLHDESLRAEYSRRGRARAEQFTWDRTWARLRNLVDV